MSHPSPKHRTAGSVRYRPIGLEPLSRLLPPRYQPGSGANAWIAIPPVEERSRAEHWRYDHGPRLPQNQQYARQAYALVQSRQSPLSDPRGAEPLPGLLDQYHAAGEHIWYRWHARHVALGHARALQRLNIEYRCFGTVVVPHRWLVPEDAFDPAAVALKIPKWRDEAQRWARRLPTGSLCIGMIEADLLDDQKTGTRAWAFHLTLLIYVPCRSIDHGRLLIRHAFPLKTKDALGIARPVVSRVILHRRGGPRGWLRYAGKGLQIHAVHRRYVPYDPATDRRGRASKQHLSFSELAPWSDLLSRIRADDLMIWSGYRRRADSVRATPQLRAKLPLGTDPIHRSRDQL